MSEFKGIRHARKKIVASCLLIFRGQSMVADVKNISATGILIKKIENEHIDGLGQGDECVLEIVVNEVFNFDVKGLVVRNDDHELAMHFTSIADDKQKDLWQLLGDRVHEVETYG